MNENKLKEALELVLMWYSVSIWDHHVKARWQQVTGNTQYTSKSLCDYIRKVLEEN